MFGISILCHAIYYTNIDLCNRETPHKYLLPPFSVFWLHILQQERISCILSHLFTAVFYSFTIYGSAIHKKRNLCKRLTSLSGTFSEASAATLLTKFYVLFFFFFTFLSSVPEGPRFLFILLVLGVSTFTLLLITLVKSKEMFVLFDLYVYLPLLVLVPAVYSECSFSSSF